MIVVYSSIKTILMRPTQIQIILIRESFSPKYQTLIQSTQIKLMIVIIAIALDKNSYFRLYAHMHVDTPYTNKPTTKREVLSEMLRCLKTISPLASNSAAKTMITKKIILGEKTCSISLSCEIKITMNSF